ncbi:MAG: hypothetical protein RML45_09160 [Acetobacteraceae bacterium]|nr:hypothetical protein [Acetobacteraceae bacterium]
MTKTLLGTATRTAEVALALTPAGHAVPDRRRAPKKASAVLASLQPVRRAETFRHLDAATRVAVAKEEGRPALSAARSGRMRRLAVAQPAIAGGVMASEDAARRRELTAREAIAAQAVA